MLLQRAKVRLLKQNSCGVETVRLENKKEQKKEKLFASFKQLCIFSEDEKGRIIYSTVTRCLPILKFCKLGCLFQKY